MKKTILGFVFAAVLAVQGAELVPEKYSFLDEFEENGKERAGSPEIVSGIVSPGLLTPTRMGRYRGENVSVCSLSGLELPPVGAKKFVYSMRIYGFGDDVRKDASLETVFKTSAGEFRFAVEHRADQADLVCRFGSERLAVPYAALPADFAVSADAASPVELQVTSLADSSQRKVSCRSAAMRSSHLAIPLPVTVATVLRSAKAGETAEVKLDRLYAALAKPAPAPLAVPAKIEPLAEFDPVKAGWKLAFADEFDGPTLDTSKWEERRGRPDLLRIEDGKLVIDCVSNGKGGLETSSVWSRHRQRYGYFESRLKFTKENGWWAAFWLYADAVSNPFVDGFEIDIFEDYHTRRKDAEGRHLNILDHNLHSYVTGSLKSWNYYETFDGSLDDYHVIGCKWTPFEISYYLDGKLIRSSAAHSPWDSVTFDAFRHMAGTTPLRTIVSGQIMKRDASWLKGCTVYSEKDLPYHYHVDYVRVYEYPDPEGERPSVAWAADYPSGPFHIVKLGEKAVYEATVKEAPQTRAKIKAVYLFDSGYLLACRRRAPWKFEFPLTAEYYEGTDFMRPGRQKQKPALEGPHALQVFVEDENGKVSCAERPIEFYLLSDRLVSRPYEGKAAKVPGVLQASRFDEGGEGVAYHDGTKGNMWGKPTNTRMDDDVDCTPHGIGAVGKGEWVNFTVDVEEEGDYVFKFGHGNPTVERQTLLLLCDFKPVGEVECPGQDRKFGWSPRQQAEMPVRLPAGRHLLRFIFNGNYNLTDFTFERVRTSVSNGKASK